MLRLFFGVQVIEVAEEFIEAMVGRKHLVAIAEVVLAELAGHVAVVLEQPGDGRVLDLHALGCARQAHLGEAGADRRLSGDERRAAGGAALLAVPVGEQRAFVGDAVDVRRLVAHHAAVVGADVELADVVAPENQDIGFLRCHCLFLSLYRWLIYGQKLQDSAGMSSGRSMSSRQMKRLDAQSAER